MGTDVIIIDPENEYEKLVPAVGGEYVVFLHHPVIKLIHLIWKKTNAGPDELSNKILDLHSLMRVIMGELTPSQDAMLDRALVLTYREKGITQDPETFSLEPPLLEDLFKVFAGMETPESREMADRLEKFVSGSAAGIFNQHSNFDIKTLLRFLVSATWKRICGRWLCILSLIIFGIGSVGKRKKGFDC